MLKRASKRYVETAEYGGMVRRMVRAYGRRVSEGAGDIAELSTLAALASDVDAIIADAVVGLHDAGYSWAEIGKELGVTRQNVHQRYGRRPA